MVGAHRPTGPGLRRREQRVGRSVVDLPIGIAAENAARRAPAPDADPTDLVIGAQCVPDGELERLTTARTPTLSWRQARPCFLRLGEPDWSG